MPGESGTREIGIVITMGNRKYPWSGNLVAEFQAGRSVSLNHNPSLWDMGQWIRRRLRHKESRV